MQKLTNHKKELLKEFVNYKCEICSKNKFADQLTIHRVKRGCAGFEYCLRNCMVICTECHRKIHYKEFQHG